MGCSFIDTLKHMEHVCTHYRDIVKDMGFAYSQPVNKISLMITSLLRNTPLDHADETGGKEIEVLDD